MDAVPHIIPIQFVQQQVQSNEVPFDVSVRCELIQEPQPQFAWLRRLLVWLMNLQGGPTVPLVVLHVRVSSPSGDKPHTTAGTITSGETLETRFNAIILTQPCCVCNQRIQGLVRAHVAPHRN